jgi:GT2 family glycosyltransferase/glycosyltransferase involved in cell wall biosynthesis
MEILLPVFNAFEDVVACLDSLLACTDPAHAIVLLDDASPDPRIRTHAEQFAARNPQLVYDRAPHNLGFVGNINRALHRSGQDVVVLNSDTVVTPGWLDAIARCRDSAAAIGIVCPLSNNATILSVPQFNADHQLPAGMTAEEMAAQVEVCSRRDYPRIPTAVGFCMLITRRTINRLGGLDPAFGKGYGEECDYSMRAWRAGIEIACCDDAYVFHRGKASFGDGAAISGSRKQNEELLNRRWPGYAGAVQAFCADNPLRRLQEMLVARLARMADPDAAVLPHVLQITHRFSSTAGVEEHIRDISSGLAAQLRFSILCPDLQSGRWADFSEQQKAGVSRVVHWHPRRDDASTCVFGFPITLELEQAANNLSRFLNGSDLQVVHFHHFANWQNFHLPAIAKRQGRKVIISLHDYHLLCPNYNLLLPSLKRCGQPVLDLEQEICRKCLGSVIQPAGTALGPSYSAQRQELVREALQAADVIIAPSEFVRALFIRAFGAAIGRRIRVILHGIPGYPQAPYRADANRLRVAYIGNLNAPKGAQVLIETARQLREAPISFVVHGSVDQQFVAELKALGVEMSGAYRREQLSDRLANTDAVVILSVWDETFCMTVGDAQSAGVPVIAPRAGGISERIRDGENGFLYEPGDAHALQALLRRLDQARERLDCVREELKQHPPKHLGQMLSEYQALYLELAGPLRTGAMPTANHGQVEQAGFVQEFNFPGNTDALGDNAYGDWFALRRRQYAKTLAYAVRAPCTRVHWLVLADASNHAWVERSIASIRACANFESRITVLASAFFPGDGAAEVCRSQEELNALIAGICAGDVDWIAFLPAGDQVAPDLAAGLSGLMTQDSELDAVYVDEDRATLWEQHYAPFFKPAIDRFWLMSSPYTGRFGLCRRQRLGVLDIPWQWLSMAAYAVLTAILLQRGARAIGHLPGIHHHALDIPGNRLDDWLENGACVLHRQLARQGIQGRIDIDRRHGYYRALSLDSRKPGISVVVAAADLALLGQCLNAIFLHTDYPDFEVLAVLVGQQDKQAVQGFIARRLPLTLFEIPSAESHAAALQYGSTRAGKEILVLLSDATLVATASWLDEIALCFSESDVGLVGGRIVSPQHNLQAGGLYLGCGANGVARFAYVQQQHSLLRASPREFSALPRDCIGVRKSLLAELGGLDSHFGHEHWPVDLGLRARHAAYRVCWTPSFALVSLGIPSMLARCAPADLAALEANERNLFFSRWRQELSSDFAYNTCLSVDPAHGDIPDVESAAALRAIAPDQPLISGVMVFPFDAWGSGQYRARQPAQALAAAGKARVRMMGNHDCGLAAAPPEVWRFAPASLLLHNFLHDYQLDALARYRKHCDGLLVFGMDDLLSDIPTYNPYHRTIYADIKIRLANALALCDRLVVTTDYLAGQLQSLIQDIRVIPNYLDAGTWNVQAPEIGFRKRRRLRVGWAGANQHLGDLNLLAPVVRATFHEVDWIFFGLCPPDIAPYASEIHDMVSFERYPQRLADLAFDLALAPLADNPFNRAKSNLRLLEYGILGTPVICSDIEPYRGAPVVRLPEQPDLWIDAIRDYAKNPERVQADGRALENWVRRHWMLQEHLPEWSEALGLD